MSAPRRWRSRCRGFTLLEVLLSLALIMALGSVMFGFVFDLLESRQRVVEVTAQHRAVAILFDRLEADLASTIVTGGAAGPGVRGNATSMTLLSRGYTLQPLANHDVDGAFRDLQQTTIEFDEADRRLSIARALVSAVGDPAVDGEDGARERDRAAQLTTGAQDSTAAEPLDAPVWRVRFRYHDGTDWRERYNSESQGQLPVAVEVAVWLRPWPGESWEDEVDSAAAAADESGRLTFDEEPVFDDAAWASRPDRDFAPEPRPDRVRVIAVPDARPREAGRDAPLDSSSEESDA